jgi:hypothetical protein
MKVKDPFAWDPTGARDPWFQRVGVQTMKPINRQGRVALLLLMVVMAAAIPAACGLALAGCTAVVVVARVRTRLRRCASPVRLDGTGARQAVELQCRALPRHQGG